MKQLCRTDECCAAPPGTPDFVCGKTRFFMARCVFQIICFLIIHLFPSPLITSNTSENELDCLPSILVPRNTAWNVRVMDNLKINCTVDRESHCQLNIEWCRIDEKNSCRHVNQSDHTTTEWRNITENKGMFFLIFHNVFTQDAGLYRCEIKSPISTFSHSITVTVTDYVPDVVTTDYEVVSQQNNTRNSSVPLEGNTKWLPFYVYICSGIGVLLIIVTVVSVIVIRCRGQKISIKEQIYENQSAATPVAEIAPPIYQPRVSPRSKTQTLPAQLSPPPPCIYDTPPIRVMSLRDRSSVGKHSVSHGTQRQCHDHGTVEEVEEENPLIYATLNHKAVPQRPGRVTHVQIEASEYAAIKVT